MPRAQSVTVSVSTLERSFYRADIEFHSLDHGGPSYQGRVFLNNPTADESTERSDDAGYAGAFHIFGHGGCLGDPGHCDVVERDPFDPRPAHPLSPALKVVTATEAIGAALSSGASEVTITIVPVILSTTPRAGRPDDVLKFSHAQIVTYG
jgi:tyrosinase